MNSLKSALLVSIAPVLMFIVFFVPVVKKHNEVKRGPALETVQVKISHYSVKSNVKVYLAKK